METQKRSDCELELIKTLIDHFKGFAKCIAYYDRNFYGASIARCTAILVPLLYGPANRHQFNETTKYIYHPRHKAFYKTWICQNV